VYFVTDGLLEMYFVPQHVMRHIRNAVLVNSRYTINVFTYCFLCILVNLLRSLEL
jgi:hypothetical protein